VAELLARLIPLGLAGAISPVAIVACIALLFSRRPLANAAAYAAGIATVLACVGAGVLVAFGPGSVADAESSRVVNALELTLGVLLLVLAAGQALGRAGPDSPPPGWMAAVERLGPGRAYAFGVLVESTNVKRLAIYLAGLSEISRSDVSTRQSVAALALFVLLLLGGVLAPIAVYAASPERSAAMLGATRAWLLTHNRRILAVLFALVGAVLIERGLAGLV
jgi:hypothetical protein